MFDFRRSRRGEREVAVPEPAEAPVLEGTVLAPATDWFLGAEHWDLCLELDANDQVTRVGGRQAPRLQPPPAHPEHLPHLTDYLERRQPGSVPLSGLRSGARLDLLLRSRGDMPLVCRFQAAIQPNGQCMLLGTDISDLNWQTESQQLKLHCLSLSKTLQQRLRHVSPTQMPEAVGEVLEAFCSAFQMAAMALVLSDEAGQTRIFAFHARSRLAHLLREGMPLPDDEMRAAVSVTRLDERERHSALLDALCCPTLYIVPAATRGARVACLLGQPEPDVLDWVGPPPADWQFLTEQLANLVLDALKLHGQRDSQRKLSLLEDMVGGGWWHYRAQDQLFQISPAVAQSLGLGAEQARLPLKSLMPLLMPADADELQLRLRNLAPGGRLVQELSVRPAPGNEVRRWLRLHGRMHERDGERTMDGVLLDISEGKQQEQQALAAHARLRNLIDSAPVVIYVQRVEEGHLIPEFYSESAGNLLDIDLQGLDWQSLAERVHPDDLEAFLRRGRELVREGRIRTEYRLRDGRGNWHWLLDEARVLRDAQGRPREAVGLWLDITEQRESALRIAASEERYRVLVEDSPAPICRYSLNLELTFVNRTFAEFLGESVEALLGRRLDYWLSERDCSALRANLMGGAREGNDSSWDLCFSLPGQQYRWLVWSDRPLFDAQGTLQEMQAVGRDDTAVRRAQQQLAQGAKMATLGEMVSGMAHEMKQPLNVLRMSLYNARQRLGDPQYLKDKLERAEGQIDRLNRVITHMGVFSRKSEIQMAPFDPFGACEEAVVLLGESLQSQGIEIEVQAPGRRVRVNGYSDQMEQVVVNLLANARDALLGKGEALSRRWVGISQVLGDDPGWVELQVRDNAGGIDAALLERIFEAFFTTKPAGKGTGLGLSVSHELIRNMGGNLSVDNYADGARFTIRLPRLADDGITLPDDV